MQKTPTFARGYDETAAATARNRRTKKWTRSQEASRIERRPARELFLAW